MSGILGGIGAKSGVIGVKDVPAGYEEGTWTMTHGWMTCTNNHTAHIDKPIGQKNPIKPPMLVATPLPPLNLSQIGKICPITAAKET